MAWSVFRDRRLRRGVEQTFDPDDVARYYDDWNERYEAVFGDIYQHLQATDRKELFDHMAEVAELADGDQVLDAGCGICGPAIEFARRAVIEVVALTVSPQQAIRAEAHVGEEGMSDRIEVRVGDFHHVDRLFGENRFDLAYFLESMVHAHDPQQVLRSVFRSLRPGGRLYIKDFYRGIDPDPDGQRTIDECVAATNRICHLTIRNTSDMLRWIEEAGFEVESSGPLAVSGYSIDAGHEFCARYDLDVAAGRDFRTTFYLDNLEIRARKPR